MVTHKKEDTDEGLFHVSMLGIQQRPLTSHAVVETSNTHSMNDMFSSKIIKNNVFKCPAVLKYCTVRLKTYLNMT